MTQSLFIAYLKKYFPGIVVEIVETLNDTTRPLTYLHRTMLRKQFSVSGNWESINATHTRVAADVVAMDSSLPLKKRDALAKANGIIPKLGMKLYLNENQLTALDTLVAINIASGDPNRNMKQIILSLFADTRKCIEGIYEVLEAIFLEGMSTGMALVDAENVGTGIRLNYGFLDANKFGVAALWTGAADKPFDDIQRVLDKVEEDGNAITKILLDKATYDKIAITDQAKQLVAWSVGYTGTASQMPTPELAAINKATQNQYGYIFQIVNRSIRTEKNGIQTVSKPWAAGAMTFITGDIVGELVYATLAEANHPNEGVEYQTVEDFILVSKYRGHDPVSEYTSSQARVVPVISGVTGIYLMDTTQVEA